jgi:hypothetical protein
MAAIFAATAAGPAVAQGFLKRLSERAIQKVERKAEQAAEDLGGAANMEARGAGTSSGSRNGSASGGRIDAAPVVMTPRAVRGGAPRAEAPGVRASAPATTTTRVEYPSDLPKPAGFEAVKAAFDQFGKVRCPSCEGGYGYDSWPSFPRDPETGKSNGGPGALGRLPIGHVLQWQGAEAKGTLTIVAEKMVGGFRCRTLQYRLVKGNASAERPGLTCWGYSGPFAGSESWNEVY